MARIIMTLAGALLGLAVGYLVVAYAACTWWSPDSNLCGLYGVIPGAPIGALLGARLGWRRGSARLRRQAADAA